MSCLSIVIPCHNEAAVLPQLIDRLERVCSALNYDYEVVCVDDGSTDDTWPLLAEQHAKNNRWKCVCLSRNFGHQLALSCGMSFARGDAVIVMDADLQDPPEELPRFIEKWEAGYDVVYAVRTRRKEGLIKRMAYSAFYKLLRTMVNFEIPLDSGDFCIMSRRMVDTLNAMPERNRFIRGMRAWSGFRQCGLTYERAERAAGKPSYTFRKLLELALNGIFAFSAFPLKLASHFGMLVSLLALVGVVFTFLQRIFKDSFAQWGLAPVPGFATIVISILFLGGVQLIFLGIIGEYLFRIYDEVKRRPLWLIREACGLDVLIKPQENGESIRAN